MTSARGSTPQSNVTRSRRSSAGTGSVETRDRGPAAESFAGLRASRPARPSVRALTCWSSRSLRAAASRAAATDCRIAGGVVGTAGAADPRRDGGRRAGGRTPRRRAGARPGRGRPSPPPVAVVRAAGSWARVVTWLRTSASMRARRASANRMVTSPSARFLAWCSERYCRSATSRRPKAAIIGTDAALPCGRVTGAG